MEQCICCHEGALLPKLKRGTATEQEGEIQILCIYMTFLCIDGVGGALQ